MRRSPCFAIRPAALSGRRCVPRKLFLPDGAAHRSVRHRRSGEGFTRRVVVSRNSWWRSPNGGAVADMVGADRLAAKFEGTRVPVPARALDDHPPGERSAAGDGTGGERSAAAVRPHRSGHLQHRRHAVADHGQPGCADPVCAGSLTGGARRATDAAGSVARGRCQLRKLSERPPGLMRWMTIRPLRVVGRLTATARCRC